MNSISRYTSSKYKFFGLLNNLEEGKGVFFCLVALAVQEIVHPVEYVCQVHLADKGTHSVEGSF